jgi:hypothetical protein
VTPWNRISLGCYGLVPVRGGASAPSITALQKAYSIASSAVASNLAFGFALDEMWHHNPFREIRDSDIVCLSLPNQENRGSKYYVD